MTFRNFIEEFCTGTGNTITLTGVTSGSAEFSSIYTNAQTFSYVIEDSGGNIIVGGSGTYNSAGDTITRNDSWEIVSGVYDAAPASNRTLSGGTHVIRVAPISDDMNNWDTAFGWGDHSTEGYLVSADLSNYAVTNGVNTFIANQIIERVGDAAEAKLIIASDSTQSSELSFRVGGVAGTNQRWSFGADATVDVDFVITRYGDTGVETGIPLSIDRGTGNITLQNDLDVTGNVTGANLAITNWNTAFGWGDHTGLYASLNGSFAELFQARTLVLENTESSDIDVEGEIGFDVNDTGSGVELGSFTTNPIGLYVNDGSAVARIWTSQNFGSTQINNWQTAYGWGDHGTQGYITSAALSPYLLNTTDTLDGSLTVQSAGAGTLYNIIDGAGNYTTRNNSVAGGWARGLQAQNTAGTRIGGIGFLGSGEALSGIYLGAGADWWSTNAELRVTPSNVTIYNNLIPDTNGTGSVGTTGTRWGTGYINALTASSIVASGLTTIEGGLTATNIGDFEAVSTSSGRTYLLRTTFGSLNQPPGSGNYHTGFHFRHSLTGDYATQMITDSSAGEPNIFLRNKVNGVWETNWRNVLHDGNFIAGTDYQAAGNYLLDTTDTLTGDLTVTGEVTATQFGFDNDEYNWASQPRTQADPNTIRMFDVYTDRASGPSGSYGTLMNFYGRASHSEAQLFFGNAGNLYFREAFYLETSYSAWDRILTKTYGDTLYQPSGNYLLNTTDTLTGALTVTDHIKVNEINGNAGQQLILFAGEARNSSGYTGLTNEYVYVVAESGLHITSAKDNWVTDWATGRNTATICDSSGNSTFPGTVTATTFVGALTGNASSASVLTAGSKTIQGSLTVGNSTSSYIYMTDTDHTTRSIHCNSDRIGFLNSSAGWGSYCDNTGNWISTGYIQGTNITSAGNVTGSSTSCTGNAATATALTSGNKTITGTLGVAGAVTVDAGDGGTGIYLDSTSSWTAGTLYAPGLRWREADGTSVAGIRGYVTASGNALALGTGWLDTEMIIFPTYVDFANDVRVSNQLQVGASVIHEGDTDTGMAFNTDEIVFSTGGATRLTLNSTASTFTGSVIASDYRATSGVMLRHYSAGWTTTTQTAIYAGYQVNTGDYIYMKAPGNSNDQGILAIGDTGLWYGDTNDQAGGGLANNGTNPFTDNAGATKFRIDSSGYMYCSRWYVGSAGSTPNEYIGTPFTDVMNFVTGGSQRGNFDNSGFDVQGAITATGNITAYSSDERLKDAKPLQNAMNMVNQWQAVRYTWNEKAKLLNEVFDHDNVELGLIAQSVQRTAPELIAPAPFDRDLHDESISRENYITVDYDRATAVLTAALQEKDAEIKDLTTRLEILEKLLLGDE